MQQWWSLALLYIAAMVRVSGFGFQSSQRIRREIGLHSQRRLKSNMHSSQSCNMFDPERASWKLWMPVSKPSTVINNKNNWGPLAEWKRWVRTTSTGDDERRGGTTGDEWGSFEYGTFLSQQRKTKIQEKQKDIFAKMAGPADVAEIDPLWSQLTDEEVAVGIAAVEKYCTAERKALFNKVLNTRTNHARFVFENPININNAWAALRTFDSFGLQFTDVITDTSAYRASSEWRRETMSSALGAQKWLSLRQEERTEPCLKRLKAQGYRIVASDLHTSSVSVWDLDWNAQKTAIVLGNERDGISDAVRAEADVLFFLPMKGFAESLNVSAFVAVLLGVLESKGALAPELSTISPSERSRILLTWLCRTAPGSLETLRRAGLERAGNRLWDLVGVHTTKP